MSQQQKSSSSSQSIDDEHAPIGLASFGFGFGSQNSQNESIEKHSPKKILERGFKPAKLPPVDCQQTASISGFSSPRSPRSPRSPLSSSDKGSTDKESDSPKPPPSPVKKVFQAVNLVSTTASDVLKTDFNFNSTNNSTSYHIPLGQSVSNPLTTEKQTVFRKVSNRILDSSSSEDEEEDMNHEQLHKSSSTGSTPSPRTPNSCRILSGINQNQATAFSFSILSSPLSSRHSSRPSSYDRQSNERQSSDEGSIMSSFRSQSNSSDIFDDPEASRLTPQPMARNRRMSPLRKQRAIAEESITQSVSQRSSLEAEFGSCPSSTNTSAPDSGVADCNYSSPPRKFFNSVSSNKSSIGSDTIRRSSSGNDDTTFGFDTIEPYGKDYNNQSSLSEGETVIESTTGCVFRKMTIKKKNSDHSNTANTNSTPKHNTSSSQHSSPQHQYQSPSPQHSAQHPTSPQHPLYHQQQSQQQYYYVDQLHDTTYIGGAGIGGAVVGGTGIGVGAGTQSLTLTCVNSPKQQQFKSTTGKKNQYLI